MRKGLPVLLAALAIALAAAAAASANPAKTGPPSSMASTGDSITRAFNDCFFPFTDCPSASWSTGTNSTVNSQYLRILALNSSIYGKNFNDAVSGAQMKDLNSQVSNAAAQHVDYVTILMGANDVCTSSVSTMTPTSTLQSQLQTALNTLSTGLPDARIYVGSIPNVYNLWQILHTSSSAVVTWNTLKICQSLLANPTSTSSTDAARRQQVYQQTVNDNAAIQQTCAQYIHCRFDNDASFNFNFTTADVSTRDYFHPSITGQKDSAALSWGATFDFGDTIAPVSTASTTAVTGGTQVTLGATDNVGVAGIEYHLGTSTAWTRYTGPVTVSSGTTITWRAVDVNGNIEATHSLVG